MCWCWANLQNTHFSGLTRKNPVFERSVLKYVSIKIPALTHSGRKTRILQIRPTPAIAFAFAPASIRKATSRPAPGGEYIF